MVFAICENDVRLYFLFVLLKLFSFEENSDLCVWRIDFSCTSKDYDSENNIVLYLIEIIFKQI